MLAFLEDIEDFARECFREANAASEDIQFSLDERRIHSKYAAASREDAPYSIGNTPRFVDLGTSRGVGGWAVILSVDLRGSSKRAVEIGPEDTYLTMHTFIPTMGELIARSQGKVGGLRGDGLFGVFGFTEYEKYRTKPIVSKEAGEMAIRSATKCGQAMIEATSQVINKILRENDILDKLSVGVGICVGDVVVTQIGIGDAVERTLYGAPVNNACKASGRGQNEMILTNTAERIYPETKGGKIRFKPINIAGTLGGQIFVPHYGFVMLTHRPPKNPR